MTAVCALTPLVALPALAEAATVANPLCPGEAVSFNPAQGQDIVLPEGFRVSVFASGLNAPTGIAFSGNSQNFQVYVLESGHGIPSRCNDEAAFQTNGLPGRNPFTPDILVFNQNATLLRILGKPTDATTETGGTNVFQPHGPAIDIGFERGLQGGRLFATDSNQATHTHNGQNNSSRIVVVNPTTGAVTPFITQLPTGDHPTEQLAFKGGWIYWSQGSTTNSGVVGLDNGSGANQSDIPCQDITLSGNTFDSGLVNGVDEQTSGYSPFGVTHPAGTVIPAFFNSFTNQVRQGVCDGAILRARLNDSSTIQAFSWGYRNPYAIRFAPNDHALSGGLLAGEDGADERGARPSNGAPESLSIARQNPDGSPDYHGWPDRYSFLPTSQAVFNPLGGPSDDLCVPDPTNPPSLCTPASLAQILKEDVPIRDVLAFPPQPITSPIAIEAADSSFTGIDFVPDAFVTGPVKPGAALYTLEGDFGFSPANASAPANSTAPAQEVGHEVKLINFNQLPGTPLALEIQRFAHNTIFEQAFPEGLRGFNRPTNVRFGPDGCAYVADYGAVRDNGQSDPASKFQIAGDGPLVQFPGTGVIWKICPM
jgi:glucose/arabinose dehydrogenase